MTGDTEAPEPAPPESDPPEWDSIAITGARLTREGASGRLTLTIDVLASSSGNEETRLDWQDAAATPDFARAELFWNRAGAIFMAQNPFTVSYPVDDNAATWGIDLTSGDQVLRLMFP